MVTSSLSEGRWLEGCSADWCERVRLCCPTREEEVKIVVETALKEAHVSPTGLTFEDLAKALEGAELNMEVDIPSEY